MVGFAAALSLLPLLGGACALLFLCPVRLPPGATIAMQTATSFANIVTPAGSGGFALQTRFVRRQLVPTPRAVATVALAQGALVFWSLAAFAVAVAVTGRRVDLTASLPIPAIIAGIAAALITATTLLIIGVRRDNRLVARALSALTDIARYTRQVLVEQPARLAGSGVSGLAVLLGSALTLRACIWAYGAEITFPSVVLVLTLGLAIGTATPIPGGVGAVETSLAAGLALSGIEPLTALLAALLYRLITFWIRVPIGWGCLIWLRRTGYL